MSDPAKEYPARSMSERLTVLVMAAGRGTRMRSSLPKVLHPVCGKPMVEWVIEAARAAGADDVVCIVRPGDGVAEGLPGSVTIAEQRVGRAREPPCCPRARPSATKARSWCCPGTCRSSRPS
ncbi:MAG: NTP transferase domain-containing protein [Thermoleophilaceae bacterium]